MIVKLTKEQIAILSFAMGLYTAAVYKQNTIIPTDMEDSAKTVKEIIDAFDVATEE